MNNVSSARPMPINSVSNADKVYFLTIWNLATRFNSIPCPEKGATLFFAITLPNANRSSKFVYHHTQQ